MPRHNLLLNPVSKLDQIGRERSVNLILDPDQLSLFSLSFSLLWLFSLSLTLLPLLSLFFCLHRHFLCCRYVFVIVFAVAFFVLAFIVVVVIFIVFAVPSSLPLSLMLLFLSLSSLLSLLSLYLFALLPSWIILSYMLCFCSVFEWTGGRRNIEVFQRNPCSKHMFFLIVSEFLFLSFKYSRKLLEWFEILNLFQFSTPIIAPVGRRYPGSLISNCFSSSWINLQTICYSRFAENTKIF